MFVKRLCSNFFGFFYNFLKNTWDLPDAGYEAASSVVFEVSFLSADDFEASDVLV